MALDSPVVFLYDSLGRPLSVQNGVATPAATPGLMFMGSDGTNSRYITLDSSGRPVIVGAGVAGTPAGGVVSIQGVASGTAIPVSGTVTATNPSVGTTGAAAPASGTFIGASDGTNLQGLRVFDIDTGAGTEYGLGVSIRLPGSGGSTAGGTSTNPLRTDPTGATTQPVSAASLPLPTGASTETTLATMLTLTGFNARINTLGSKTSANSTPVVIASDQGVIPVITTSATATRTDVAGSASSVTILASNASRKGAIIVNDSSSIFYLRYGATATTVTDFTDKLFPGDRYTVEGGYTGQITGIWASATGSARMTELT